MLTQLELYMQPGACNPLCILRMVKHDKVLVERFGEAALNDPSFPAFPIDKGEVVFKAAVTGTIEGLATRLGQPLVTEYGRRVYGAHTMRVTGAVHLTEMGI